MSEWLHLWHEKDSQSCKKAAGGDKCTMQDSDYGFYGSDSDSDLDEGTGLKNVMLVTGPVGVLYKLCLNCIMYWFCFGNCDHLLFPLCDYGSK